MTFSNANIITPKTRRILEATNDMLAASEAVVIEEAPKKVVKASPDKILLKEATESGKFSYQGFGIYKEADTTNNIGRVWIKKEVIDEVTGEKQEWLIAYTNEEEDFARSLATRKLQTRKESGQDKIYEQRMRITQSDVYKKWSKENNEDPKDGATVRKYMKAKNIKEVKASIKQSYDGPFGADELQRGHSEIDNKIKDLDMPELEEPTKNPFNIPTSDAEVFDGSGTVIQMGSTVQNEFGKEGKVADILSPTKVTVSWFDKTYTEGERGDTIYPGDIKVTGSVKESKHPEIREFEMSASNEKGDYCVVSKNGDKFSGECGSITSAKSFNDPELHDAVEFATVENATRWFDTKIAKLGLATDKFHGGANPYDIVQEFAQILEANSKTPHKLSKVAGRGIYAMHPSTMRGYEEPLPELSIDDLVVDTRTDKSGLIKQIQGDVVDVLIDGRYTMSVPIGNVRKLTASEKKAYEEYKPAFGEPTHGNVFKYLDEKSGEYYEPVHEGMLIKDLSRYFNISNELANKFLQEYKNQKTAGQPKPEDIPIAPGIKSKNITLDESGGQGTAKVTIDFTNVDQGLKFYQEQVTEAPAPAATPAPAPEQQIESPAAPKVTPQGPPMPISSSLKFSYDERVNNA